ncbi:MAG: hemerythrin family protein [Pirellulales bacterium]|nr:hemerythrin family protein [Pirellulales bacterium]
MANQITWKNYYSVNEPSLDAEHKQIINCINDLYSALNDPKRVDLTKQILDALVQYTQTHFEHEEKLLKEVGFPTLDAHKALHDEMKRKTFGLRTHWTLVTNQDVLVFLKDWWIGHIQGEDKLYASYMPVATTA